MGGTFRAALLYAPGDVRVEEIPMPLVGSGEVLVRLAAVSLCPTDIRKYRSLKPDEARLLSELGPIILGHEGAGEVVEVGTGVANLHPGDHVAIQTVLSCGQCANCRAGRPNLCLAISGIGASVGPFDRYVRLYHDRGYGGCYAEYIKVPAANALRIPTAAAFADGALFEPLADVVHSIDRLDVGPEVTLVVVGLGPMGLLHVPVARVRGAAAIVGIDPIARRRQMAQQLGATAVIDPGAEEPAARVRELTSGRGADRVAIVVGGSQQAAIATQAAGYLARDGVINLFAGAYPSGPVAVDHNLIHYSQLTITGTVGYRPQDAEQAVRLIAEGHVRSELICTPHMPLADIQQGMELYGSPDALKIALDPEPLLLGFDVGTHSLRGLLVDASGRVRARAEAAYARSQPEPGAQEQAAEDWWAALAAVAGQIAGQAPAGQIAALCIAHQRGTIVPADTQGHALRPALCDSDVRCAAQVERLAADLSGETLYLRTGCPPYTLSSLPKILWVKEHEPQLFGRAAMWLTPHDYLVYRLTGRFVTSDAAALRTGLLDIRRRTRRVDEVLTYLGLSEAHLPAILAAPQIAGGLTRQAAAATGLPTGLPVILGLGDQIAGLIGAGALASPEGATLGGAINLGTSFVATLLLDQPAFDPERRCTVEIVPGQIPEARYALETGSGAGTNIIDWFCDTVSDLPRGSEAELTDLARGVPPGAEGLAVNPAVWNAFGGARGATISGIAAHHGRGHLFRAILEGLAADAAETVRRLNTVAGRPATRWGVFGGAAANDLLCQLLANRLGVPVQAHTADSCALGAAILAAAGAGIHPSLAAACQAMVPPGRIYASAP